MLDKTSEHNTRLGVVTTAIEHVAEFFTDGVALLLAENKSWNNDAMVLETLIAKIKHGNIREVVDEIEAMDCNELNSVHTCIRKVFAKEKRNLAGATSDRGATGDREDL